MKMIFISLLCCLSLTGEPSYEKIFGEDYHDALLFIAKNKKIIETSLYEKEERAVALSVVFPELIRYSMTYNFLETAALEVSYQRAGSGIADFSIGPFQMKPSFFEALERAVAADTSAGMQVWQSGMRYPHRSDSEVRGMRLRRLKSLQWQIWYLRAFCQVARKQLQQAGKWPNTPEQQIRLLATAYNAGFHHHPATWEALSKRRFFPYGPKFQGTQFAYADVATDFYAKYFLKR